MEFLQLSIYNNMQTSGKKLLKADQKKMKEIIHSGHFMVSDIDDPEVQEEDDSPSLVVHESDCDQESLPLPEKGFDFESACKETSKTYTFGSRSSHSISIDASLTKLFECMTLAYSGKLTSPRWKQFKGLKLRLKEKIRLNNMIWRAWHMQFVMRIKTDKLCQFATPLDGDTHMKPEAVVIEGTYWKRRMANITAEYKKWRLFYKDRSRLKSSEIEENVDMDLDTRWPSWPKDYTSPQSPIDEDFIMDFTDTLFTTLHPSQGFDFPNPREIAAKAGIADFIQPGLVQLQPPVDDFMDTLEPLSDLFSDFLNSKLPPLPEEGTYSSSNLQDSLPCSSGQQDIFSSPKSFERSTHTVFSPLNLGRSHNTNKRIVNFKKSSIVPKQTNPTYLLPQPYGNQPSGKPIMENVSPSLRSNNISQENVPLLASKQLPSPPTAMQPFMSSPLSQNSTIASLLQGESQKQVSVNVKREKKLSSIYQEPAFTSKSFDEPQITQHSAPMQMPLQVIPQGQPGENMLSNVEVKSANHPVYFSVNLGQMNSGSFKVSNMAPTNLYQAGLPKLPSAVMATADSPTVRRHSYTTGQYAQSGASQSSGDYMSSRRSRLIVPATTAGNFIVPEIPFNKRTRSRSVSSPQSGSPKSLQQPVQAVSLTDISSPLQTMLSTDKRSLMAGSLPQHMNFSTPNVVQQNAILAQLLAPGCSRQNINQALIKVTSPPTANVTSPVTIIRPVLGGNTHTFVLSSLPVASTTGITDLQQNIMVGSNNQSIRSQDSPSPSNIINSPESPSSSTCSSSPAISSVSFDQNQSISKGTRLKSDEEKIQYKEHRRVCHINAEQKRRCNIKNGFESLHNLLPPTGQASSSKISKAAMLQRGADYIRTLKNERQQQLEEVEALKQQIEKLNQDIGEYQRQLPASGAPIPCQRNNRLKEMFSEYTREQTHRNWKFYIFSLIMESLVDSFNNKVSTVSYEEMCKTTLLWLDEHCSLLSLRPNVLNSLRHLSTSTSILSNPCLLPDEAIRAVTKKENDRH